MTTYLYCEVEDVRFFAHRRQQVATAAAGAVANLALPAAVLPALGAAAAARPGPRPAGRAAAARHRHGTAQPRPAAAARRLQGARLRPGPHRTGHRKPGVPAAAGRCRSSARRGHGRLRNAAAADLRWLRGALRGADGRCPRRLRPAAACPAAPALVGGGRVCAARRGCRRTDPVGTRPGRTAAAAPPAGRRGRLRLRLRHRGGGQARTHPTRAPAQRRARRSPSPRTAPASVHFSRGKARWSKTTSRTEPVVVLDSVSKDYGEVARARRRLADRAPRGVLRHPRAQRRRARPPSSRSSRGCGRPTAVP